IDGVPHVDLSLVLPPNPPIKIKNTSLEDALVSTTGSLSRSANKQQDAPDSPPHPRRYWRQSTNRQVSWLMVIAPCAFPFRKTVTCVQFATITVAGPRRNHTDFPFKPP